MTDPWKQLLRVTGDLLLILISLTVDVIIFFKLLWGSWSEQRAFNRLLLFLALNTLYGEVIGWHLGKWRGRRSWFMVIAGLIMGSVALMGWWR